MECSNIDWPTQNNSSWNLYDTTYEQHDRAQTVGLACVSFFSDKSSTPPNQQSRDASPTLIQHRTNVLPCKAKRQYLLTLQLLYVDMWTFKNDATLLLTHAVMLGNHTSFTWIYKKVWVISAVHPQFLFIWVCVSTMTSYRSNLGVD